MACVLHFCRRLKIWTRASLFIARIVQRLKFVSLSKSDNIPKCVLAVRYSIKTCLDQYLVHSRPKVLRALTQRSSPSRLLGLNGFEYAARLLACNDFPVVSLSRVQTPVRHMLGHCIGISCCYVARHNKKYAGQYLVDGRVLEPSSILEVQ